MWTDKTNSKYGWKTMQKEGLSSFHILEKMTSSFGVWKKRIKKRDEKRIVKHPILRLFQGHICSQTSYWFSSWNSPQYVMQVWRIRPTESIQMLKGIRECCSSGKYCPPAAKVPRLKFERPLCSTSDSRSSLFRLFHKLPQRQCHVHHVCSRCSRESDIVITIRRPSEGATFSSQPTPRHRVGDSASEYRLLLFSESFAELKATLTFQG